MASFVETFFSIQLVPKFPFFARLTCTEISISDRFRTVCYSKPGCRLVKFDLIKKQRWFRSSVADGDNIHAIMIAGPNADLLSILSIPDSETLIWFRGYQWKWTKDHEYLRVYDEASAFWLTAEEACRLKVAIQGMQSGEK